MPRTKSVPTDVEVDADPPVAPVTHPEMPPPVQQDFTALLPKARADSCAITVALDLIDLDPGLKPKKGFQDSIERQGQLQAVWLCDGAPGRFAVVDGARRIRALRNLGKTEVDAIHYPYPVNDLSVHLLRFALNAERSDNPAAEAVSIQAMFAEGFDEKQIRQAAPGTSIATIRERQRTYSHLINSLKNAWVLGGISDSQARAIARLFATSQQNLADIYQRNGHLTHKDIDDQRKASAPDEAATASLFDEEDDEEVAERTIRIAVRSWRKAGKTRDAFVALVNEMFDEVIEAGAAGGDPLR